MTTVSDEELRDQVAEVLRRVEAGETLIVTVSGRGVAELSPVHRRRWVGSLDAARVWRTEAPRGLREDLTSFPAETFDLFAGEKAGMARLGTSAGSRCAALDVECARLEQSRYQGPS